MRKTTRFTGGDTIGGSYLYPQEVRMLRQTAPRPGRDDDEDDDSWRIATIHDGLEYLVYGDDLSPHPEEAELNTEFVVRMMEYGSPLVQGFVLQAIEQFSLQVLAMPEEQRAQMDAGFVTYGAWQTCAHQCLGLFAARDEERRQRDAARLTPAG